MMKIIDSTLFKQLNYINGQWLDSDSRLNVLNPASNEIIGSVPNFGKTETEQTIEDAHSALLSWEKKLQKSERNICKAGLI